MKKLLYMLALAALVSTGLFAQTEADFDVEQLPDNTLKITKYKGSAAEVTIPSTISGLKVTVIGAGSFSEAISAGKISSVVIPDTVREIEEGSFRGGTKSVLVSVTLGKGLVKISKGSFFGNTKLTTIVIPNTVTFVGESAFEDCGLTTLTLGSKIQSIGDSAFRNNKLTELSIPNSVILVGDRAFEGNPIGTLTLPVSLATRIIETRDLPPELRTQYIRAISILTKGIANTAFTNLPLVRITLPANMNEGNLAGFETAFVNYWKSQKNAAGIYYKRGQIWTKITAAEAAQMDKEAAAEAAAAAEALAASRAQFDAAVKNSGFTVNILADTTLEITGYTGKTKDLVIPGEIGGLKVKAIGSDAFREKIAAGVITSVVIPDTVETIGIAAFSNMVKGNTKPQKSKLTSVTLGAGLKGIGDQAFVGNLTLKTLVFNSSPVLGENVFTGCGLTSVTLPAQMNNVRTIDAQLIEEYQRYDSSAGVYTKIPMVGWVKKPGSGK
jgi:hypothetical protein